MYSPIRWRFTAAKAAFVLMLSLPAASAHAQLRTLPVTLTAGPKRLPFRLQVADNNETRATGLMYRRSLPSRGGMLFAFEDAAPRSFWMKDTFMPLDMLFVDAACLVVDIVADAKPHATEARGSRRPVQYVVELAGGSAAKFGIVAGSQLAFEDALSQRRCPPRP